MIGPQRPLRWCSIRVAPRVPKDHESTVHGGSGLGATFRGRALQNDTTIVMLGGEKPARVQDAAQRQGAQSVELGEEAHPQKLDCTARTGPGQRIDFVSNQQSRSTRRGPRSLDERRSRSRAEGKKKLMSRLDEPELKLQGRKETQTRQREKEKGDAPGDRIGGKRSAPSSSGAVYGAGLETQGFSRPTERHPGSLPEGAESGVRDRPLEWLDRLEVVGSQSRVSHLDSLGRCGASRALSADLGALPRPLTRVG
jgi:hypothetical protein